MEEGAEEDQGLKKDFRGKCCWVGVCVAICGGGVLVVRDSEEVGEAGMIVGGRGVGGWMAKGRAVGRRLECSGDWRRGRVDMRRF